MNKELQELNEKLLRFAGFCMHNMRNSVNNPQLFSCADCGEVEGFFGTEYPDFTSSLDAQVKWLWPNIPSLYEITIRHTDKGFQVTIHRKPSYGSDILIGEDNILALASARAIEQLIDG